MTTLDSFINPKPATPAEIEPSKPSLPRKERPKPIIPWTKKYLPSSSVEFIGNKSAKSKILKFIQNFDTEKKKAILLWGPNGVGKSCIVNALSKELNLEFVEFNASDKRNKAIIEEQLGNVLQQQSLFGTKKLVLIDDIDGVSGAKDRGGAAAIAKLSQKSKYPIIITCLNPYTTKVKPVRSKCQLIELKALTEDEIASQLKTILLAENITFSDSDISIISKNSRGDLRAAINDCQMLTIGTTKLDVTLLGELENRLKTTKLADAIKTVLKGTDAKELLGTFDRLENADLDKVALWMDQNMPEEYTNKVDRARAYGCLTKVDVFKSRIMRRQHWRFLVYINALLSAGIATAKTKPYTSNIQYKDSTRILKMWQANMKYGKRKSIADKIAKKIYTSQKRVIQDFEFYSKLIISSKLLSDEFELDSDEVDFCKKISVI